VHDGGGERRATRRAGGLGSGAVGLARQDFLVATNGEEAERTAGAEPPAIVQSVDDAVELLEPEDESVLEESLLGESFGVEDSFGESDEVDSVDDGFDELPWSFL
jgi:hypothetical protein